VILWPPWVRNSVNIPTSFYDSRTGPQRLHKQVYRQFNLSLQQTATKIVKSFIDYIHQLIQAWKPLMETQIDEDPLLSTHWAMDWDVATIIEALEELHPFVG